MQPADAHHASARLGLTLRSIILGPKEGFAGAFKVVDRRARAATKPAEGYGSYALAFVGGAALVILWLKLGSLLGLREFCTDQRVAAYLTLSLVVGGLLGLAAQALWGVAGTKAFDAMHAPARAADLRLVWGASAFPQVLALVLLLPLDLLIVGGDSFTSRPLVDTVSTAWAAFSIAAALSFSVWSLYLFVRGTEVATSSRIGRGLVGAGIALLCLVAVVACVAIAGALIAEGGGCPTRLG